MEANRIKFLQPLKNSLSSLQISSDSTNILMQKPSYDKTMQSYVNDNQSPVFDDGVVSSKTSKRSDIRLNASNNSLEREQKPRLRYQNIVTDYKFSFFKAKNKAHRLIYLNKNLMPRINSSFEIKPFNVDKGAKTEIELKSQILNRVEDYNHKLQTLIKKQSHIQAELIENDRFIHKINLPELLDKVKTGLNNVKGKSKYELKAGGQNHFVEHANDSSKLYLSLCNPMQQINSKICFPIILNNREMMYNLWNDNIQKWRK